MKYLHIVDGERIVYPYDVRTIRKENPNVSFPRELSDELLAKYDVYRVEETPCPPDTQYETWQETIPHFENRAWRQRWEVVKKAPPESITRRQCAIELLERGVIGDEEALTMTKSGEMPKGIRAIVEKHLEDPRARIRAEIDFAAANYYRDNELLKMMGLSEDELDAFFILAGSR